MTINPKLLEPTVYYTNPNPTADLGAGNNGSNTGIINNTYVIFEIKIDKDGAFGTVFFKARMEIGKYYYLSMGSTDGSVLCRTFTIGQFGKITWSDGYQNGVASSRNMIPVRVIGTNIL